MNWSGPGRKYLWISFSRSGDSPEGVAVLQEPTKQRPGHPSLGGFLQCKWPNGPSRTPAKPQVPQHLSGRCGQRPRIGHDQLVFQHGGLRSMPGSRRRILADTSQSCCNWCSQERAFCRSRGRLRCGIGKRAIHQGMFCRIGATASSRQGIRAQAAGADSGQSPDHVRVGSGIAPRPHGRAGPRHSLRVLSFGAARRFRGTNGIC